MLRLNKEPLISLAVVVLIVGGYFVYRNYFYRPPFNPVTAPERAADLDIKEYSLGGEVLTVDIKKAQLTFKTGWITKTDKGSEFVYYTRTVNTTKDTKFYQVIGKDTFAIANKNPLTFLKVGDNIVVYGTGNPYVADTLTATKIEVHR